MADSGNLAGVRVTQKKLDGNVLNNFSCGLGGSDIFRWVAGYFFSSLHYRDGGHREKKAALNSIVMISTKEGGGGGSTTLHYVLCAYQLFARQGVGRGAAGLPLHLLCRASEKKPQKRNDEI